MHWYMTLRAVDASFRQHHRLPSEVGDVDILRTHASAWLTSVGLEQECVAPPSPSSSSSSSFLFCVCVCVCV